MMWEQEREQMTFGFYPSLSWGLQKTPAEPPWPAWPSSTRTRVCFPPRAFSTRSAGCTMLTQHRTPPDINTAGILVPFKLPSAAAADGNRTRFPAGPLGRSQQSWSETRPRGFQA
jgi:hypothetical protein